MHSTLNSLKEGINLTFLLLAGVASLIALIPPCFYIFTREQRKSIFQSIFPPVTSSSKQRIYLTLTSWSGLSLITSVIIAGGLYNFSTMYGSLDGVLGSSLILSFAVLFKVFAWDALLAYVTQRIHRKINQVPAKTRIFIKPMFFIIGAWFSSILTFILVSLSCLFQEHQIQQLAENTNPQIQQLNNLVNEASFTLTDAIKCVLYIVNGFSIYTGLAIIRRVFSKLDMNAGEEHVGWLLALLALLYIGGVTLCYFICNS